MIDELERVLDQGFRQAAVRQGMRWTIPAGRPPGTHRRPTAEELDRVVAVARASGTAFVGVRNEAILRLMARTGMRPMTLLAMASGDFVVQPERLFLRIKEKGRGGKRPIEVPDDVVPLLNTYVDAFNRWATVNGWSCRVGMGVEGPFWRATGARKLQYSGLLRMAETASSLAGVEGFHLHGLRHMRAGQLGQYLGLSEAALAGGWRATGVFDRHYARGLRDFRLIDPQPSPPDESGETGPTGSEGQNVDIPATVVAD